MKPKPKPDMVNFRTCYQLLHVGYWSTEGTIIDNFQLLFLDVRSIPSFTVLLVVKMSTYFTDSINKSYASHNTVHGSSIFQHRLMLPLQDVLDGECRDGYHGHYVHDGVQYQPCNSVIHKLNIHYSVQ